MLKETLRTSVRLAACCILLAGSTASASDRSFALERELEAIDQVSAKQTPQAGGKALLTWLRNAAPDDLVLLHEFSRSNTETGIFLPLAQLSRRGAHELALEAAEELERRALASDRSFRDDIAAVRTKLLLRLGRMDAALALARDSKTTICGSDCAASVRAWLDSGAVPAAMTAATGIARTFDERGKACDTGYRTDRLDEFDSIDLVEGKYGVRSAARTQLAIVWPQVVAGCVTWVDKQRLQRLLDLAWTRDELRSGFQKSRNELERNTSRQAELLGVAVALPANQCDFAADANCDNGAVPLATESLLRLWDRWRPLHSAWESIGVEVVSNANREVSEALEREYHDKTESLGKLEASTGLVKLRELLRQRKYSDLGPMLDNYYVSDALDRWSREGHADDALSAYVALSDLGGDELRRETSSARSLALLQLRAGKPQQALATLERSFALHASNDIEKAISKLRAGLAGGDLAKTNPAPDIKRPWAWNPDSIPMCEYFDMEGLSRIDDVDLIAAFQGERAAALWMLQQHWSGVVDQCFNSSEWKEARQRLHHVLGDETYKASLRAAMDSVVIDNAPHFDFAGVSLPLPDRNTSGMTFPHDENKAPALTREAAIELIRQSGL